MNVNDLISKLSAYAAQTPENGAAEVIIKFEDDCYPIKRADDVVGFGGSRLLAFVPDFATRFRAKKMGWQ